MRRISCYIPSNFIVHLRAEIIYDTMYLLHLTNQLSLLRIPPGTSPELTDLLHNLLKRNPKERLDFNAFFTHPFLATAPMSVPKKPQSPVDEEKSLSSPETAGFVVVPPMPKSKPIPVPNGKSEPSSHNNSPSSNKNGSTPGSSNIPSAMEPQKSPPRQKSSKINVLANEFCRIPKYFNYTFG
jgi:hypothetical protein